MSSSALIAQDIKNKTDKVIIDSIPQTEIKDSIPITVIVYFEVNPQGQIQNVKAKKVKCKKCDDNTKEHFKKEAVKAVASSPDWESPEGGGNGKTVSFTMPIKFMIEK